MTFVFYDTETTGLDPAFDQILQFAAIKTDGDLNVIETFDVRGRLLPHVLPSPEALLVTGVSFDSILSCPLSHFEMMQKIRTKLASWSTGGAVFAGWNSMRFDEHFLRQSYYQSLLPIYQTQTNGNGRADIMRMVQVATAVSPNTIAVPMLDDGKAMFRLGPVAEANEIKLDNAHEALADTGATLAMAQLIKMRHPRLWAQLLSNARKASVLNLIEDHPALLLSETHAGRSFNFVAAPIVANSGNSSEWGFFDLQFDPTDYVDAPDDALKAALVGNKKAIRKVAANSQPGLLPLEFCPEVVRGGRLSVEVYQERSRVVREHSTFRGRVASLLARQYADQPKPENVEQRIYEGFPSRVDERLMSEFHAANWPARAQIVEDIEDQRYRQFGRRILATERLSLLSPERQRQYADWRRERLLASGDVPWRTLSEAREEVRQLSEGASEGQRLQLMNIEEHLRHIEAALSA